MKLLEQLAQASAASPPKRVLGIDLGTTNSTVAQVQLPLDLAGTPELLCECISIEQITPSGPFFGSLVPSVVAIDKSAKSWIGEGAKRMRSLPRDYGLSPEKNLFHDTKNEIGLRKRYHRAPEDYDHARKIAGHVLRFLAQGARKVSGHAAARTVVTVPASFQLNQRADTLEAATLAGLSLTDYDLLDEPLAALTDYLFTFAEPEFTTKAANIVVFDFGGGTCDVFAARLKPRGAQTGVDIEAKAVSRYHRLGGSDFDAAIIHEVLIPALLKENNLPARHFEWGDRKRILEPALRGCAEALKEGLCREVAQLHLHGRYQSADKTTIAAKQMATAVRVGETEYLLAEPRLTAAKWEEILEPFLSTELLHVRQTDFCQTLSIFAPISDAMERARLTVADVHFVLMAGGSSLVPQVQWAVEKYFPAAKVLSFPDSTAAQTAIARGAAWSAAWLEATGQPLVRPVTSDAIALRVRGRSPITLIDAGVPIPFPADGSWATKPGLVTPKQFNGLLKVEIVTLPDEQTVLHMPVQMDKSLAGEPLLLQYRFTAARCFECALALQRAPDNRAESSVENPLVNVANPGAARVEIEEIEEELRDAGPLGKRHTRQLLRLASLYREIRMLEKAAEVLKSAARVAGEPDELILNLQGLNYEEIGDFNRMETCYKEAVRVSTWSAPFFNWALHCYRQKRYDVALEKLDEAIVREPSDGAYLILKARILQAMGKKEAATQAAETGMGLFPPIPELPTWQQGWFESGASILNREADLKAIRQFRSAKKTTADATDSPAQEPEYTG
ncbi:MAG TPA: Hsp70 family protein [Verrucomicrobiae bacterium]|nr:Hsp70 family protein [Verrucomicrobiae bacterium]